MAYTLKNLPTQLRETLTKSFHAVSDNSSKDSVNVFENNTVSSNFKNGEGNSNSKSNTSNTPSFIEDRLIWASGSYVELGDGFAATDTLHDVTVIEPRVLKTKESQQKRVKDKAEVFSPSWLCNLQNNMVDDALVGSNSFNTAIDNDRKWIPTTKPVNFSEYDGDWMNYVQERRIEITCGEAPYLMSPYDSTTGEVIPVLDSEGRYQRIGVLDRKLRVVSENSTKEDWNSNAFLALASTFGYEWQGDNLLLARLNFLNTYIEYFENFMKTSPTFENLQQVSEIAAWNLWQMDGLKTVQPLSCSEVCESCLKKKDSGHDGRLSVVRFLSREGWNVQVFEDF